MSYPLLAPLFFVIAGILAGKALEFSLGESAWPLAAFTLLALLAIPRARWVLLTARSLAILFAGIFLQAVHAPRPTPTLDAGAREVVVVEGCVVEPTVFSSDREQFTLELDPGARARVSLPVEPDAEPQRLAYGQRVEIEARLRSPHNFNNPGGFDYANYLGHRKIFWTAAMPRRSTAKILDGRCGSRMLGAVFALRTVLLDRIDRLYPDDEYATGMLQAILLGETSRLERIWTEDFRRTGSFHALVISGVHVTVLAGVLLFLLRLVPISELAALAITAAAAWLYALLAGMSAPVVRAAGGFSLYLLARVFFRRTNVLNLLAAVALVYLAWDPEQLFDASFQLSFLAVAALGALAAPLIQATSGPLALGMRDLANLSSDPHLAPRVAQFRVEVRLAAETLALWTRIPLRWAQEALAALMRLLFFFYEMVAISLVIQVGLALPMVEYFHRLSFTGLSSNLLIVPAMNALVPAGFLAVATGWHWTAAIVRALLSFSAAVAAWHARHEPGLRIADPPAWFGALFMVTLVALPIVARTRFGRWSAIAFLAGLFGILIAQPWPAHIQPHTLELTAIDVGQGDSLLLTFPEGAAMLVDGGGILSFGRAHRTNFDMGEDVVSPYLWSRGIRRLDVIVATHAHQDHIGGLPSLLANFRPRELWTGANPPAALLEIARNLNIRIVEQRQAPAFAFSGARIQVLAPTADYASDKPGNNDSLAFRVEFGKRSFLLTGDLERRVEAQLLATDQIAPADVLKVGHHGSRTSTIEPFLAAVSPSVALISAGFENSFGHPHPDVTGRLQAHHAAILRTDLEGLATVRTDGTRISLDLEEWHPRSAFSAFPLVEGLIQ